MTGGSLGLRTGSYGSLQPQSQNSVVPVQTSPISVRKPSKMLNSGSREKERLIHWMFKFFGRKKVGMLLLCVVSAAVFGWVLYIGKGEDASEGDRMRNIRVNSVNGSILVISIPDQSEAATNSNSIINPSLPLSSEKTENLPQVATNSNSIINPPFSISLEKNGSMPPPPPAPVFLGYTLPPDHPCEKFTLPSPPADKKRTGPRPCPVCYLSMEEAIAHMPKDPSPSPVLRNLTYVYEEHINQTESFGGSVFGGYPSLKQRNESYDIKETMTVHCGFVGGTKPGRNTGFDIDESDLHEMEQCREVVVATAIFGNYDVIQQPKNISEAAKKNACFFMFLDGETEAYVKNTTVPDSTNRIGLWRIVSVRNLPYTDARRNGKVPKLLLHRLFPNARYSIWIDGKLELVVDPYLILERFLWRKNSTFAISRHYRRFDVFVEAEANKVAGKYDNASIDMQIEFYKSEGLTSYSEAKLPITSDVPEGCVIIREHIPITNLFTCLWFNEVDRFTARDQLSFSTVRDKIISKVDWSLNMFLDCERRNFVVQAYHRELLEQMAPPLALTGHPPPSLVSDLPPPGKSSTVVQPENIIRQPENIIRPPTKRRGRDRRSSSRRHRKVAAGSKETTSTQSFV
ncbi:Protein of unknown function DUF616 [Dillenia turbinata]|uniref:TOD1/MUCI70 glycosyltransferase-like domain-containing protein n=1 Tax=Dillenia turbinata TaxID=194707 RepID=A0AAN8VN05_9MAGN